MVSSALLSDKYQIDLIIVVRTVQDLLGDSVNKESNIVDIFCVFYQNTSMLCNIIWILV